MILIFVCFYLVCGLVEYLVENWRFVLSGSLILGGLVLLLWLFPGFLLVLGKGLLFLGGFVLLLFFGLLFLLT